MDSALKLRLAFEQGEDLKTEIIDNLLKESKIIGKIFNVSNNTNLTRIFQLVGLAEIPYSDRLAKTQEIIKFIDKNLATDKGFSYTGQEDGIVPCYNAMLLESYVRLGLKDSKEVVNSLNWIKQFQLFRRNLTTSWKGKGISLHGGCLNAIPCYIGIGKCVRALITYDEFTNGRDKQVKEMIDVGVEYMLQHHMFLKLSENSPISRNITYNSFPQSYFLTLTDLVYILGKTNNTHDDRAEKIMELLNSKKVNVCEWKLLKTFVFPLNASEKKIFIKYNTFY